MSDEFDQIADEELHGTQYDPQLAADVPPSMQEGNRGLKPPVLFAGIGVLGVAFAVALAGMVHGALSHPQPARTTNTFQSAASGGVAPSGMVFGQANGAPALPTSTPLPANAANGTTSATVPCAPNYHAVRVTGYPVTCVADNVTPTPLPAAANAPIPAPTATPLPPQQFGTSSTSSSQTAQAQADIAARSTPSVSTQSTTGTTVPVYNDGRIVAYQTVPAQEVATQAPVANGQAFTTSTTSTAATSTTRSVGYMAVRSHDQLDAGTIIPASLITAVNSDLPGTFLAQVTAPIYDSRTHQHEVVPSGAFLQGACSSRLVAGQTRLLCGVSLLRFPDGREFDLGTQEGTDAMGAAGFVGHVNRHSNVLVNGALLMTVLGGASAALSPQQSSVFAPPNVAQQIAQAAGAQITNVGSRIINASIGRPPTITIHPPYNFDVLVTRDLPLDRYEVQPQHGRLVPATPAPATPQPMTQFCCRRGDA